MTSLFAVSALGLLPIVAIALLWFRLRSQVAISDVTPEWLDSFSMQRYRPMERLLAEEDFTFLRSLPGYRPEIEQRLRKERRVAFRRYLNRLVRDFHRLHAAARQAVAYSDVDQSHLVGVLVRQRARFAWLLVVTEARLACHAFGFKGVEVGGLVAALDGMGRELRMAAVPSAA